MGQQMDKKTNDLVDFMQHITQEVAREYSRIQKRAREDPGTAGDQGEENWATILRNWLPPIYQIVTKGRVLAFDGWASPQVDILVLHPSYPKQLLDKKLYLAGGIAAAFECKLTLRGEHIKQAVENASSMRRRLTQRIGTPYRELHSSILYGLLAHSHVWKGKMSTPRENVEHKLLEADRNGIKHPREMLDVFCVADLATWKVHKIPWFGPENVPGWEQGPKTWYGPDGSPYTCYMCHAYEWTEQDPTFSPIGALIAFLLRRIAWEDMSVREIADYFAVVNLSGKGAGSLRRWELDIYSEEIRGRVKSESPPFGPAFGWNEWGPDI